MESEKQSGPLQKSSRNYGIDALRIVSMLMIVVLHILGNGGIIENSKSTNFWVAWFLEIACFCAVNCYALISGYVGVFSKYKIGNLAYIWCQVAFYSVLITMGFKVFCPQSVGKTEILSAFLPIVSKQYWYVTAYAILFLFIPFLNAGIEKLSQKQLGFFLGSIFVFSSLLQPVIHHFWGDVFLLGAGYSALWLIILYVLGGYIHKYGLFDKIKRHRTSVFLSLFLLSTLITWCSKFLLETFSKRFFGKTTGVDIFINYQSITMVASAVFLLLAFEKINFAPAVTKIIAFLSPLAFSVYLIHVQHLVFEKILKDRFLWVADRPLYQMLPLVLAIALAIYIICSAIDFVRLELFKAVKLKALLQNAENGIKEKFGK